jgi:outer membrane protein OmpA-like peptidoglycan-associated protein
LPPEKALKINLQVFIPKEFALPESPHAFSVFFPKGSHVLGDQESKNLDRFIHELKEDQAGPVSVAGYTCRLGSDDYNQKLALNRARTVADYLKRHGVSVLSVTSNVGGGYVNNTDPAQNRRVEITLPTAADQLITNNQKGGGLEINP